MNNEQFEVTNVVFPNDEIAICYYKDSKDMHIGSNQTNVVIAAFVTAQARLKLYSELRKIGKDLVYCDTDSVFYIKGKYEPLLGDFLGMFTNEIDPAEGTEIVEFVSAGPKNYSYKLDTGKTHTKIKGFDLMNNEQFEVTNVVFPNDEIAICYYKDSKDMHIGSNKTNVVIAAFVTPQARLKLYLE